ncbi:MAG: hypothetical protein AAB838_04320 [Patescibacteria group bacterium]
MFGSAWNCEIEGDVPTLLCIGEVLTRIVNVLLLFAGATTVLLLIWASIRYITASGDPKGLEKAKNMFTYALIGLLIIILSFALVKFFGNLLGVPALSDLQFNLGN